MKRQVILILALLSFSSAFARADSIAIGLLSFDVLIPADTTSPGINAFDIFNFTGPTWGPFAGTPYASDSLTFQGAMLTVTPDSGSPQTFNLGDIGPGELLDPGGNPIVQVKSTDNFTSATFTATLSPTTFLLSDGSTFNASGLISVDLTPSPGPLLQAGVDFAVINAQRAPTPVPEPSTLVLLGTALVGIFGVLMGGGFIKSNRRTHL